MAYPILQPARARTTQVTSTMAKKGMNRRDLSQLLNTDYALIIKNYILEGEAKLVRRKGQTKLADQSSTKPTMLEQFLPNIILFGYATTVAALNTDDNSVEVLKSDFPAGASFDGARAGDYFMTVDGVGVSYRFYRQITASISYDAAGTNSLTYASQSANFTVGQVLTGAGSGATATITADDDGGTSGTLTVTALNGTAFTPGEVITDPLGGSATLGLINPITGGATVTGATSGATATVLETTSPGSTSQTYVLGSVSGTFQSGEVITSDQGSGTGRALTTSVLSWANAAVSDAPKAAYSIDYINGRFVILKDYAAYYSDLDVGTNPPGTSWTVSSDLTGAGRVEFRNLGALRSATNFGPYFVVFGDNGWSAFAITGLDSAGTLVKKDDPIDSQVDFGGSRNAINTEKGLFYVNEGGLYRISNIGQTDVPASRIKDNVTQLLGDKYFEDVDFTDADIVYDMNQGYIFVTCSKASSANNLVIGYSPDREDVITITGWNLERLLNINQTIYGASSVDAKIFKLFDGYEDDGEPIPTEFYQELQLSSIIEKNNLNKFFTQARLSEDSVLTVEFDTYNARGCFVKGVANTTITPTCLGETAEGFEGGFESEFDGASETEEDGLITTMRPSRGKIRNWRRIFVRITSNDRVPHEINWLAAFARNKRPVRANPVILNYN